MSQSPSVIITRRKDEIVSGSLKLKPLPNSMCPVSLVCRVPPSHLSSLQWWLTLKSLIFLGWSLDDHGVVWFNSTAGWSLTRQSSLAYPVLDYKSITLNPLSLSTSLIPFFDWTEEFGIYPINNEKFLEGSEFQRGTIRVVICDMHRTDWKWRIL